MTFRKVAAEKMTQIMRTKNGPHPKKRKRKKA